MSRHAIGPMVSGLVRSFVARNADRNAIWDGHCAARRMAAQFPDLHPLDEGEEEKNRADLSEAEAACDATWAHLVRLVGEPEARARVEHESARRGAGRWL